METRVSNINRTKHRPIKESNPVSGDPIFEVHPGSNKKQSFHPVHLSQPSQKDPLDLNQLTPNKRVIIVDKALCNGRVFAPRIKLITDFYA